MKKTFVLDENILIAAAEGSHKATTLLALIVRNCHSVAMNASLLGSYWRNLRRRKSAISIEIPKLLGQLTYHSEKCRFLPEEALAQDAVPLRHQKDVFLVRIARAANASPVFIVLKDRKAREDITKRTGLTALTLAQGIEEARDV